jgi:hypothetical protein
MTIVVVAPLPPQPLNISDAMQSLTADEKPSFDPLDRMFIWSSFPVMQCVQSSSLVGQL